MKIRKETPSWFIIADSKTNQQSFQKFTDTFDTSFETTWIKSNGKTQNVSTSEKILEALAANILDIKNDKSLPNNVFIENNFNKLIPLFDHFNITVVFDQVSHLFVENILLQKLHNYHINQKRYHDMCMWLPPAFYDPFYTVLVT
jgi:hypothetical protein